MAANKPFANLDRLSKLATPQVQLPTPAVQQGGVEVNINFANRISLSDRLQQTQLGTTKHLAQFFLSDTFTNYIKIKPTKTLEHTSDVEILPPPQSIIQGGVFPQTISFSPQQGGELPKSVRSSFLFSQAAIEKIKDVEVNNIKLSSTTPILDKTLQQGTYYQNAQLFSNIQPETPPFQMEQGVANIQNLQTTPQQGGTDSTAPVSVESVTLAQGTTLTNGQQSSLIDTSQPLIKLPIQVPYASLSIPPAAQNEVVAASTIPSGIVVNSGWFNGLDWQGKKSFTLIPDQGVQLKTAGYLAKSLAFRTLPTVMHGGNNPTNQLNKDGFAVTWTSHTAVSQLLNAPDGYALGSSTIISILQRKGASGYQKNSTLADGAKYDNASGPSNTIQYANTDATSYKSLDRQQSVIDALNRDDSSDAAEEIGTILKDGTNGRTEKNTVNDKYSELMKSTNQVDNEGKGKRNNTVQEIAKDNIEVTKQLSSTDSVENVSNELTSIINKRKTKNNSFTQDSTAFSEKIYKDYDALKKKAERVLGGERESDKKRPGATVKVTTYDGDDSVVFDAFIKNFSDGIAVNYTDYTHIGQQDTFKVFKGTTRQLSLGLSVFAMKGSVDFANSDMDAKAALKKVDKLMRLCGVGQVVGNYIKAPIIKITIVGLVEGIICACNNVKFDIPITDTAWDVDTQIPQSFDVTLDLAVLAMQSDKLLTRDGKFYNV